MRGFKLATNMSGYLEKVYQQNSKMSMTFSAIIKEKRKCRSICWIHDFWNEYEMANLGTTRSGCCIKLLEKTA